MSGADTTTSDDLIRGKSIISDRVIDVLYDSRATHSFISLDCVKSLDLPITPMRYDCLSQPIVSF